MSRRRIKSNRFLPEYVTKERSQHGTIRYKFRRKGFKGGYFKSQLGTEDFRTEYHAFLNPGEVASPPVKSRAATGSLDEALDRYMSVAERLGPSRVTQEKITAVLEDFRTGDEISGYRGTRILRAIDFEAIDKIIAKKRIKTGTGNKTKGGIHAARKLRKELVRFFSFAMKAGLCDRNPAAEAEMVKVSVAEKTKGFHTWTEADIQLYRDRWAIGTRERLAMEIYLWTDQRRCDVHKMGKAQIVGGRIPVIQAKTGKEMWVPLAPQLLEAIIAMPVHLTSPFCFVVSRKGTAYTKESFGNWFKDNCVAAGLLHHNGHGLRKATLRRLAELQAANKTMKALSGQEKDETLAIYTADADQIRLADEAVTMLARWEMKTKAADGHSDYRFTAND
jgi:integrase